METTPLSRPETTPYTPTTEGDDPQEEAVSATHHGAAQSERARGALCADDPWERIERAVTILDGLDLEGECASDCPHCLVRVALTGERGPNSYENSGSIPLLSGLLADADGPPDLRPGRSVLPGGGDEVDKPGLREASESGVLAKGEEAGLGLTVGDGHGAGNPCGHLVNGGPDDVGLGVGHASRVVDDPSERQEVLTHKSVSSLPTGADQDA